MALQRMGALEHFGALLSCPTPIVRELAVMGMGDMCIGIEDIKAIVLRESGPQLCELLEVPVSCLISSCYLLIRDAVCRDGMHLRCSRQQ